MCNGKNDWQADHDEDPRAIDEDSPWLDRHADGLLDLQGLERWLAEREDTRLLRSG